MPIQQNQPQQQNLLPSVLTSNVNQQQQQINVQQQVCNSFTLL
jgi:hypothetical protein